MFRPIEELPIRRRVVVAALTCALLPAWVASAQASPPDAPVISAAEAGEVLDTAVATVAPQAAPAGAVPAADASVAVHDLVLATPALNRDDRRRANALFARPTEGNQGGLSDGYPQGAHVASASSPNFCVFYVDEPGFADTPDLTDANGSADGDGVPDYVEEVLSIAEFSRGVEVAPGPMGWKDAKPDKAGCGSDPAVRSDIYLEQLGTSGNYGYAMVDGGQGRRKRSLYGFMVIDDDYAKGEYGYDDPLVPARVTFAHEFNHLLQFGYDAYQGSWVFESTATWSEEKVYPDVNDYLGYVDDFARYPTEPVTAPYSPNNPRALKIYGAATWNHWLDAAYGQDAIRRVWEVSGSTNPADFGPAAYDQAISEAGGKSFSREWAAFAAATAEWRTGYGGFPDAAQYPDVKRKGALSPGKGKSFKLDHTGYRPLDVQGASGDVTLTLETAGKVRSALALIGRDGDAVGGDVTVRLRYLKRGGKATVTLPDAGSYDRVTALVVNADDRTSGFSNGDWVYAGDDSQFRARLSG